MAANTSASSQQKPGNEFADAAKKLAAQGAKGGSDGSEPAASRGNAAADASLAGAKTRQGAAGASGSAQRLPTEEQLAAEQWLRRIPDDPGGLLRRKFLYQYRQRSQQATADTPKPERGRSCRVRSEIHRDCIGLALRFAACSCFCRRA